MVQSLIRRAGQVFGARGGAARSSVRSSSGAGLMESLEARQLMTADLALEVSDALTLPSFLVPGDRPVLNFLVRNNSPESFTGRVNIRVQMFPLDLNTGQPAAEATYAVALPNSVQLTNLAPDAAAAINLTNFDMPAGFNADGSIDGVTPGQYFLIASIFRPDGQTWTDEFSGNDQVDVTFDQPIDVVWGFGNLRDRTNVTFIATDADEARVATRFSMTMTGGGSGEFEVQSMALGGIAPPPVSLDINLPAGSAASAWNVVSLAPTSATGTAKSVDLTMDFDAALFNSTTAGSFAINAAPLNLTGEGNIDTRSNIPLSATFGNITGSIDVFNSSGVDATVRQFIAGNIEGTVQLGQSVFLGGGPGGGNVNVTTLRVGNVSVAGMGAGGVSVGGDVASATTGDLLAGTGLFIDGNATAVTVGDASGASVLVSGSGTSFRVGDITDTSISYGGRLGTFVAGNLDTAQISLNENNRPYRYGTSFTAQNVVDTTLFVSGLLSTLTVNNWVNGGRGSSVGYNADNSIFAYAIGTVTTRNVGTGKGLVPGDFDATLVAAGGINRPTQIGTVNIAGEFGGFIVANGSVGSITAASIDTFGTAESRVVPSILVNGRLGSLTSPNLVDAQVFASNIGTITATLRSNAVAQVLAGTRFDIEDLLDDPTAFNISENLSYGSGAVANMVLTVAPAATGINFRASAGITASQVGTFTSATATRLANTVSRLGGLTINGTLTNNTFRMGFISFPASVRIAGATVAVPATGAITSPGDTLVRLSRPVG